MAEKEECRGNCLSMSAQVTLPNGYRMFIDDLDSLDLGKNDGIYEPYETSLIMDFVNEDMICVDVGANIGYHTLLMVGQKAKYVYAFEPERRNYDLLCENVRYNDLATEVITCPFAVGPGIGHANLYKCADNNGMHRTYFSKWCSAEHEIVNMVNLDAIVKSADFVKIDVEGAEYGVLLGMQRLLKQGVIVMMEFHVPSIKEYGIDPILIKQYLDSLNYRMDVLPSAYLPGYRRPEHMTWSDFLAIGEHPGINVLCIPITTTKD
jgi:FkbM family methyltransferase